MIDDVACAIDDPDRQETTLRMLQVSRYLNRRRPTPGRRRAKS